LKKTEVTVGFQKSFLHEVRSIHLALQSAANLEPGQQSKIVPVQLQQGPQRGITARPCFLDYLFEIHIRLLLE
jgi:hypothetical protein